jgi:DNA-binding GntR family transcriptional regulator
LEPEAASEAESLADQAYAYARSRIAGTTYNESAELTEVELAQAVGVSRTPVREAVRRLLSENLISLNAKGRIVIPALGHDEIHEAFTLRAALEGVITGAAATRAGPALIARLQEIAILVDHNLREKRNDRLVSLNAEFHELIAAAAGMPMASRMLSLTAAHFQRFRAVIAVAPDIVRPSLREHEAIVEALERKQPGLAEELARQHVLRLRDAYLGHLTEPVR